MSQFSAVSLLGQSLQLTFKNFFGLLVLGLLCAVIAVGPIAAIAASLGYFAQHPEMFETTSSDGEQVLTTLGRFLIWHGENQWLFPVLAVVLVLCASSWLCGAWFRKLAGQSWIAVPLPAWVVGILVLLAILVFQYSIKSIAVTGIVWELLLLGSFIVVTYVVFRFAPFFVGLSTGEDLSGYPRDAMTLLVIAAFFAAMIFGLSWLIEYIDQSYSGPKTLTEWVLGWIAMPLVMFWWLSAVFLSTRQGEIANEEAPAIA